MTEKLKYILYGILVLDVIGIFLAFVFAGTVSYDEYEHLRMSWLVSQGYIPYRDFFEHHHPLLWYTFAPAVKMLPHNFMLTYYIAKFFSLIFSGGTFYIIYLILKKFFADQKLFIYFCLVAFIFYPLWYGLSFFKPDVFEHFFYFAGLYFYFKYIEDKEIKYLAVCGIFFTISFLFLQTAIFDILPLAVPAVLMIYKNNSRLKDYTIAAVPSLFLLFLIFAYFYCTGSWEQYLQLNWILNCKIFDYYPLKENVIYSFALHLCTGILAWIWLYKGKRTNKYINIVGLLYVCEIFQHVYYKAFFAHYLVLTFIFCAMIISPVLKDILSKGTNKLAARFIIAFMILSVMLNFISLGINNNCQSNRIMILINKNTEDAHLTLNGNYFQIYSEPEHYYEMYSYVHFVDDKIFNRFPDYNVNEVIKRKNPKYIDYGKENLNARFEVSPEVLSEYKQIFPYLWQRKDTLPQ